MKGSQYTDGMAEVLKGLVQCESAESRLKVEFDRRYLFLAIDGIRTGGVTSDEETAAFKGAAGYLKGLGLDEAMVKARKGNFSKALQVVRRCLQPTLTCEADQVTMLVEAWLAEGNTVEAAYNEGRGKGEWTLEGAVASLVSKAVKEGIGEQQIADTVAAVLKSVFTEG